MLGRWRGWRIGQHDAVYSFPIIRRHHLDRIPRAAIEKRTIRTFARTLLTSDTEIRIYFDSSKWRMVLVGNPKHTGLNRTVLDTRRRSGAASATIGGDGENTWPLLSSRFPVALRHRPMFFYDIEHPRLSLLFSIG